MSWPRAWPARACSSPAGAALGEPRHVRIALRDSGAPERLLGAIDKALG